MQFFEYYSYLYVFRYGASCAEIDSKRNIVTVPV
jgi:hypothetical protein